MIRPEVAHVAAFAPLPREAECSAELIGALEAAVGVLPATLTGEEAEALLAVLATPDEASYYGLLWPIVHAVESAPTLPTPIWDRPGPWFDNLRIAARNAGLENRS